MAITYNHIQLATTDTFQQWLTTTNSLSIDLDNLAKISLTADTTLSGAAVNGNSSLKGNFDAYILSASTGIRGGTNTFSQPLNILSPANIAGALTVVGDTLLTGNIVLGAPSNTLTVNNSTLFTNTVTSSLPIIASITGNAATATKLETARTVTLTGGVTGSASFDGSANITIATIVPPVSVDAATLDGLDSLQFLRSDVAASKVGNLTLSDGSLALTAGSITLAVGSITALNGDIKTKTQTLVDGTNIWQFALVSGNVVITYNGTRLFKLDTAGNMTVKGDITAFGTP